MRQASKRIPDSAEKTVRDIRRNTRRHHSAEEKIRIVLEAFGMIPGFSIAASMICHLTPLRLLDETDCCPRPKRRFSSTAQLSRDQKTLRFSRHRVPMLR
jgi:hypothetical protein